MGVRTLERLTARKRTIEKDPQHRIGHLLRRDQQRSRIRHDERTGRGASCNPPWRCESPAPHPSILPGRRPELIRAAAEGTSGNYGRCGLKAYVETVLPSRIGRLDCCAKPRREVGSSRKSAGGGATQGPSMPMSGGPGEAAPSGRGSVWCSARVGSFGGAWLVGALHAIGSETGWDPGSADYMVGTSAGAMVGALFRSLRYQRTSVPDGKFSTLPTSS